MHIFQAAANQLKGLIAPSRKVLDYSIYTPSLDQEFEVFVIDVPEHCRRLRRPDGTIPPWIKLPGHPALSDFALHCGMPLQSRLSFLHDPVAHSALKRTFEEHAWDPNAYGEDEKELRDSLEKRQEQFKVFRKWNAEWGFRIKDHYTFKLYRYGTGGFVGEDEQVFIRLGTQPSAAEGGDRAYIAAHEMLHIGLRPLLDQYRDRVSERCEEHLVDSMCCAFFGFNLLYQRGPEEMSVDWSIHRYIEPFLTGKESLSRVVQGMPKL